MGSPSLDRFANWPRLADRREAALRWLSWRWRGVSRPEGEVAGARGAAGSPRSHAPPGSAVGAMQLLEPEVHDVAKAVWPRLPG